MDVIGQLRRWGRSDRRPRPASARRRGKPLVIERRLWQLAAFAAGTAAAATVRQVAVVSWRAARHEDPPIHPSGRDVRMADALAWAVSIAVGAAVAKVLAERATAAGWEKATGSPPPDVNG
jgi:hypothetical protein